MPTISVIIPAYNAERTILETIESVQQQTFSDLEIIVINDGSTDKTLDLLYGVKDKRLQIFSYKNGGVSTARNRGISHATGEFIAFLDADDLWTPDKLELQLDALRQYPEAGVAYSWTYFMFEEEGRSYVENSHSFEGNVYADLLLINFLHSGSNPLIRKQAIDSVGEFDYTLIQSEDWDYWLRLAAKWRFTLVPKPQILYRQRLDSASNSLEVAEKSFLISTDKAFSTAPSDLQHLKNKRLAWGYKYLAQQRLKNSKSSVSEVERAGQKLWMAICLHPQSLLEEYTQNLIKWWIKRWVFLRLKAQ